MANGARWQMCWERRDAEGIVLHDVTYTPPAGDSVEVLGRAALAQIFVPYDDNWARFHDLSDYGLGTIDEPFNHMNNLTAGDCPNGDLVTEDTYNVLCQTEAPAGYSYKDYDQQGQATSLNLFSVSHIGAYNYVVAWNFDDDGTIRPEVGATGQLQAIDFGGQSTAGWPLGGGRIGIAHMHSFYLAPGLRRGRHPLRRPGRGARGRACRRQDPAPQHPAGVHDRGGPTGGTTVVPELADPRPQRGQRRQPPDLLRDRARHRPHLPGARAVHPERALRHPAADLRALRQPQRPELRRASPNQVSGFVNGEGIAGQDLVVWYGSAFHHLPRDEDEDHMHPHWSGFSIIPRDLTATNPTAP